MGTIPRASAKTMSFARTPLQRTVLSESVQIPGHVDRLTSAARLDEPQLFLPLSAHSCPIVPKTKEVNEGPMLVIEPEQTKGASRSSRYSLASCEQFGNLADAVWPLAVALALFPLPHIHMLISET